MNKCLDSLVLTEDLIQEQIGEKFSEYDTAKKEYSSFLREYANSFGFAESNFVQLKDKKVTLKSTLDKEDAFNVSLLIIGTIAGITGLIIGGVYFSQLSIFSGICLSFSSLLASVGSSVLLTKCIKDILGNYKNKKAEHRQELEKLEVKINGQEKKQAEEKLVELRRKKNNLYRDYVVASRRYNLTKKNLDDDSFKQQEIESMSFDACLTQKNCGKVRKRTRSK